MKHLAMALLAGCWQQTIYVGPRVDSTGVVGIELGATLGGALPTGSGAAILSVDASHTYARAGAGCPPGGCAVEHGSIVAEPEPQRGAVRGLLEWASSPRASDVGFVRLHDVGWRAGGYGGIEEREHSFAPLLGVEATVSPWAWGYDGPGSKQYITLGFQLGAEATPLDGRYAGRAALVCDLRFLPKRW